MDTITKTTNEKIVPRSDFAGFMANNVCHPDVKKLSLRSIKIMLARAEALGDSFDWQYAFASSKEVTLKELVENERDFLGENDYSYLVKELIGKYPDLVESYTLDSRDPDLIDDIFVKEADGSIRKTYPEEFINEIEPELLNDRFYLGTVYDILTNIVDESYFSLFTLDNGKMLQVKTEPVFG